MISNGVEYLSNIELLSVILNTGNKKIGVEDLSNNILNKYSLEDLKDIT